MTRLLLKCVTSWLHFTNTTDRRPARYRALGVRVRPPAEVSGRHEADANVPGLLHVLNREGVCGVLGQQYRCRWQYGLLLWRPGVLGLSHPVTACLAASPCSKASDVWQPRFLDLESFFSPWSCPALLKCCAMLPVVLLLYQSTGICSCSAGQVLVGCMLTP